MIADALVFTGPREVTVTEEQVGDPDRDEILVDTELSAISPGTELLIYRNEVPTDTPADISIDSLDGDLSYPTRYGYATVGTVGSVGSAVDEQWRGQSVFVFHPHQSRFNTPVADVVEIPPGVSLEQAVMIPTVETATNLLLDGSPQIGERVAVFGAGTIGLCTTRLLADYPLENLTVIEPLERRRELAISFGADEAISPDEVPEQWTTRETVDLIYEVSGQPSALDSALDIVGYDGRIVVGSWYGSKRSHLDLGTTFHRDRVSIESSQVSTISPHLRGRWTKDRRLRTAFEHLDRIDVGSLITDRVPISEAPAAYHTLDTAPETAIQTLLTYHD